MQSISTTIFSSGETRAGRLAVFLAGLTGKGGKLATSTFHRGTAVLIV